MTTEHQPPEQPYWTDERELTTLSVGRHERLVQVRSHIAQERYAGIGSETLFPLREKTGERTYVQSHLYFHAPKGSSREQRLADSQAWWYPTERAIVLWELLPASPLAWRPDTDPREDFVLRSLWLAYERFLLDRFPAAQRFLTTWEDEFARPDWEGFLRTVSYERTAPAVFSKSVPR